MRKEDGCEGLKDKVALITGGGTGIGRATALRLAGCGVHTAINYSRSGEDSVKTKADCEALGVRALACQADVADDAQVRRMVSTVVAELGRLDILVNSAGRTYFVDHADLEGLEDEYWDELMDVNVKGLFHCCRAGFPELKKNQGCIVNITSVVGLNGRGSSIAYSASKAAAISVTKSLARVMAPEVRVNSVAPGVVMTRWVAGQEEHVRRQAENSPLGRAATPEEVADVAHSLIAQASFVTGQTVVVDGGMFL